jgi:hypothetical protein
LLYVPQDSASNQPLCFLPSSQAEGAVVVEVFAKTQVRDIVTRGGLVYVLTGQRSKPKVLNGVNPDEALTTIYDGEVFSSRDLKHAVFETKALPNPLEVTVEGGASKDRAMRFMLACPRKITAKN